MNVENYVVDGESILCEAAAKQEHRSTRDMEGGELACTEHRLIFAKRGKVIDVSLPGITSIEYQPRSILNRDTLIGALGLLLAPVIYFLIDSTPLPEWLGYILVLAAITLGIGYLWEGIVNRFARLDIHTPTESYKFVSKDGDAMEKIPHAVRHTQIT